jgi:hypothetical protein
MDGNLKSKQLIIQLHRYKNANYRDSLVNKLTNLYGILLVNTLVCACAFSIFLSRNGPTDIDESVSLMGNLGSGMLNCNSVAPNNTGRLPSDVVSRL